MSNSTTFSLVSGRPTIDKDPQATLDYTLDFTDWLLAGDSIASYTTTASGCTVTVATSTATTVVVWVAGGTVGSTASVTVHVTTTGGRIDDRTLFFRIKQR